MSDFRKELAERMAELERERIEAEPWCIGKRVIKDKKAEDGFCVVDEGGETVASYRELLQRGRARDFVPFGDPPSVPGLIAVFHPAAMSLVEDLDVFKKMARRFDSDVFVYQEGGKWWLIALAEPEYGEGRNLFVVHPDGKSKVLAAS